MLDRESQPEEWRSIPHHEGYEASSIGRIRSIDRYKVMPDRAGNPFTRKFAGKVLSLLKGRNGYLTVQLPIGDVPGFRHLCVNRLVFAAFFRIPERWEEVDHGDLDRANNAPANLSAMTVAENRARRVPKCGMQSHYAKLNDDQVREIRLRLVTETQSVVAADYGVSRSTVGFIKSRATWSHL
jgi:hypothetical protein